jgi:hypothetical protein
MMKLSSIKTQVIFATAVIVTGSLNFILLLQMVFIPVQAIG